MTQPHEAWKVEAFVDGELDLAGQLEIEGRLPGDPALRRQVEELRFLREQVREHAEHHAAPAALRARVEDRLRNADASAPGSIPAAAPSAPPERQEAPAAARLRPTPTGAAAALQRWFGWRQLATSMAFGALLAVAVNGVLLQSARDDRLADAVVASHVRSTLGQHLVDVASSDHHTVKPFLSSKLDFSPPVGALQVPGSVFVGGRIDYLDGRPVAALVYRQGEHVVNAFVWPGTGADSAPRYAVERGYQTAHWSAGGMNHWVISDVNREEFERIVSAVRANDAAR